MKRNMREIWKYSKRLHHPLNRFSVRYCIHHLCYHQSLEIRIYMSIILPPSMSIMKLFISNSRKVENFHVLRCIYFFLYIIAQVFRGYQCCLLFILACILTVSRSINVTPCYVELTIFSSICLVFDIFFSILVSPITLRAISR